jgi:cellulose synthase operon protein C
MPERKGPQSERPGRDKVVSSPDVVEDVSVIEELPSGQRADSPSRRPPPLPPRGQRSKSGAPTPAGLGPGAGVPLRTPPLTSSPPRSQRSAGNSAPPPGGPPLRSNTLRSTPPPPAVKAKSVPPPLPPEQRPIVPTRTLPVGTPVSIAPGAAPPPDITPTPGMTTATFVSPGAPSVRSQVDARAATVEIAAPVEARTKSGETPAIRAETRTKSGELPAIGAEARTRTGETRAVPVEARTKTGDRAQPPPMPSRAPAREPAAASQSSSPLPAALPRPAVPHKAPAMPKAAPQGHPRPTPAEPVELRAELRLRADRLRIKDPLAAARALVELGIHEERAHNDRRAARKAYEGARALARSCAPALVRLRRHLEGRQEGAQALEVVADEVAVAEDEGQRADLLAERARQSEVRGMAPEARKAFAEALALAPRHPASLRGLESLLRRELGRAMAPGMGGAPPRLRDPAPATSLAAHLERLAAAVSDAEPALSAWLEVERAEIHDDLLQETERARAALERAVSIEPGTGPVRDALVRHLVRHGETQSLVESLLVEADAEADDHRAARLLYTAARLLLDRLQQSSPAIAVLQKAAVRAPARTPTRRRVLGALVPLLEAGGDLGGAADGRALLLAETDELDGQAHEHVALSDIHEALGDPARAAEHARRALQIDPDDTGTQDRLDRALQRLGRHEERVAAWVAQANAKRPGQSRSESFARAADIASRHLGRRDEAIAHLRSAWVIDPGNGEIFDALAGLIAPPAKSEGNSEAEGDARGARDRIELYTQAAHAAKTPARKVALLEKVAHVWEDELAQPERALHAIERVLEIEPTRQAAILALQRNAARAGDARRLARGLVAEANLTSDKALARRLLVRAADVLADRVGDRDQALALVDQALTAEPGDPDALRARTRLLEAAGRFDEARRALVALAGREAGNAFGTWVDIARLDELKLKRPHDAVRAYQEAARIKPNHPLPRREIVRLLRRVGDWKKLCEALAELVENSVDPNIGARLLFEAAEVQELCLGDDDAAVASLERADTLLANDVGDPAVLESLERILVRKRAAAALAALYDRWLDRGPPPDVARRLALSLVHTLGDADRKQAIKALETLLANDPADLPALRRLEHLHRASNGHTALEGVLRAEAKALSSPIGRAYTLWEIAAHEEALPPETVLGVLGSLVSGTPGDSGALDAGIRIAARAVAAEGAPPAARAHLAALLRARKELARESIGRAAWQLEVAALREEVAGEDPSALRGALDAHSEALALWPESLLAARGVNRLGRRLSDANAVVTSELTLSKIVDAPDQRAQHLVRAAELTASAAGAAAESRVLGLYEEALSSDPENAAAALALARLLAADTARLADRLGDALSRSRISEQIVLLGTAIGRAALRPQPAGAGPNATVGIEAMRKVVAEAPDDPDALRILAGLLEAQQLWREAEAVLAHLADVAKDQPTAVAALFELARAYEGPLGNPFAAEAALERVLAIDARNKTALERLHQVALARGDRTRSVNVLARLIETEPDLGKRLGHELALAQALRDDGDRAGAVRALCNAVASAPSDPRAWQELASMHALDTPEGASGYAKALGQLLEIATARRAQPEARWLTTLGLLEITHLRKTTDGLAHLERATKLPGATNEARVALGRGLEAVGKNAEAVTVLREALTADALTFARVPDLGLALAALESALAKEGRADERSVVEEVRALLGEAHKDRVRTFRARSLPAEAPVAQALAGSALAELLVPEAQSPLVDVALALAPVAGKALRFDLAKLGVGSRDRIGPRDGHPTRYLADRIAQALGLPGFELYLTPSWQGAARVYPGDPPAIVGPASFVELPEPEQAFALGRLLTRAALGFTWLDELPLESADALLLATLRSVDPTFADGELSADREQHTQTFLPAVQKAIGRRQRKLLESVVPTVPANFDMRAFSIGVRRTEYRTAYVLAGNLVASVDYLRRFDAELARSKDQQRLLLEHPVTNELLRFALTAEAYAERRRLGTAI